MIEMGNPDVALIEAAKQLTDEQVAFICTECAITEGALRSMTEDELYDVVYETMCQIEIDEVCENIGSDEDTVRCAIASDIVTLFGNAIAETEGYLNED